MQQSRFDPMDEIDGSIIVLDVFDIDEYSLNPRKKANSQRAEIKASMKGLCCTKPVR
ncbi:hypothetical protein [Comamonas thiooxydans]|uniref:hypothetical protein n=1 Tax=Comamonas thiooxydans TaxID=363952 RepID=UPI003D018606